MRRGADDFTEAALVVTTRGEMFGEYVAQCARNMCGYFGKWPDCLACLCFPTTPHTSVYMERIHARHGIPVRTYTLCGKP